MTRLKSDFYPILILLAGCTYTPPATLAPVPRAPTIVDASMDRLWIAVIDFFADRNIPIRTLDRVSGFIATDALRVQDSKAEGWADCGSTDNGPLSPTGATYNIRVRGDSVHSTVQITVRWTGYFENAMDARNSRSVDCVTLNTWEADAEGIIKARAEAR